MADSFIAVAPDSTGKNLQTFKNTVSATEVHAEAVALVDTAGAAITTLPVSLASVPSHAVTNAGTFASQTNEVPDATSTYAPTNATSTAFEASRVIKNSAGVLFSITGYNSRTSAQFIQLHNAAALPAEGAAPILPFRVGPQQNFSYDLGGKFGRFFSTGIVICNSSTADTKTIGSSDCWFDVQYK